MFPAEKFIVLNLLNMAATGELDNMTPRPPTSNVQYNYWSQLDSLDGAKQRSQSMGIQRPRSLSVDEGLLPSDAGDITNSFKPLPLPESGIYSSVCTWYIHAYLLFCRCSFHWLLKYSSRNCSAFICSHIQVHLYICLIHSI